MHAFFWKVRVPSNSPKSEFSRKLSDYMDVPLEASKRLGSMGYNPNIPRL